MTPRPAARVLAARCISVPCVLSLRDGAEKTRAAQRRRLLRWLEGRRGVVGLYPARSALSDVTILVDVAAELGFIEAVRAAFPVVYVNGEATRPRRPFASEA